MVRVARVGLFGVVALLVGACLPAVDPGDGPGAVDGAVPSDSAVCEGGSEDFPVSITLPPDTVTDVVDVALIFDDTGSFASFVPGVADIFSDLVTTLETDLPSVDFGFGVARFEDFGGPGTGYSSENDTGRPFTLNQPIVTATDAGGAAARDTLIGDALDRTAPGFGGDGPETALEGLYQAATGAGFDGDGNGSSTDSGPAGDPTTQTAPGTSGDVPPFSTNVATTSGSLGGVGWRTGALHLAIVATDIGTVSPFPTATIPPTITGAGGSSEPSSAFDAFSRFGPVGDAKDFLSNTVVGAVAPEGAATVQETLGALNALGIRVLGMGPGAAPTDSPGPSTAPSTFLSALARLTGAVDDLGEPLVFSTSVSPADLADAIADAISTATTSAVDITTTTTTLPAGLTASFSPPVVPDVGPGETADFTMTLTGDGSPISGSFDVQFVDEDSGAVLGTEPFTVECEDEPVEPEICDNGIDDDGDGLVDGDDPDCVEDCDNGIDDDGDGLVDGDDPDCAVPDTTAPACDLVNADDTGIDVEVQDAESGLASVDVVLVENATVTISAFSPGTTDLQTVRADKVDLDTPSRLELEVTDEAGNVTRCDPVLTTMDADSLTQAFGPLPSAEHYVTVRNHDPGLDRLTVSVNGVDFVLDDLAAGEERTVDVADAIIPGLGLSYTLTGEGAGSAVIVVWDGQGTL